MRPVHLSLRLIPYALALTGCQSAPTPAPPVSSQNPTTARPNAAPPMVIAQLPTPTPSPIVKNVAPNQAAQTQVESPISAPVQPITEPAPLPAPASFASNAAMIDAYIAHIQAANSVSDMARVRLQLRAISRDFASGAVGQAAASPSLNPSDNDQVQSSVRTSGALDKLVKAATFWEGGQRQAAESEFDTARALTR